MQRRGIFQAVCRSKVWCASFALAVALVVPKPTGAEVVVCHSWRSGSCDGVKCDHWRGYRLVKLDDGSYTYAYYGFLGSVTVTYC